MDVIRPIAPDDLDDLYDLALAAGYGFTSLPRDKELLRRKIKNACNSFKKEVYQPGSEYYLFVLESESGKVIGTSGILARVGGYDPWYSYKVEKAEHESPQLGVFREISYLRLITVHSGPTLIGTLLLSPDYRKKGQGRMLSLSRFLFMADFPELFQPVITAEMRGVSDSDGRSPFWDALGRKFFDMEFPAADYQSSLDKGFIAELMPQHPVYIPLLDKTGQEVIGEVHRETQAALKILEMEGFRKSGMVDIFDGGPQINCPVKRIRAVRKSKLAPVGELQDSVSEENKFLISAPRKENFRVVYCGMERGDKEEILISKTAAEKLQVQPGDEVRYVALYPKSTD